MQSPRMERRTRTQMTIPGSYPVVTPWMPRQDTLILWRKMNCQIRLRLRLHQEVILNVIHLEFVKLLITSAVKLGISNLYHLSYFSFVFHNLVWGSVAWLIITINLPVNFIMFISYYVIWYHGTRPQCFVMYCFGSCGPMVCVYVHIQCTLMRNTICSKLHNAYYNYTHTFYVFMFAYLSFCKHYCQSIMAVRLHPLRVHMHYACAWMPHPLMWQHVQPFQASWKDQVHLKLLLVLTRSNSTSWSLVTIVSQVWN